MVQRSGFRVKIVHRCLASLAESEGGWPDYVLGMLRDTALSDITEHALFYREPSDCHIYGIGRVTLLGDAAHLTAAALGQARALQAVDPTANLCSLWVHPMVVALDSLAIHC